MVGHRWVVPGLAAGAVVVVAAGVAIGLGGRDADPAPAAAAPVPVPASTAAPAGLVRDGDRVAVSGRVVAVPDRPVRVCAPLPENSIGYEPGHEPVPAYCAAGVTVRGLDLGTIAERTLDRGVVTGRARVEGTYVAGVVTVTRQGPPDQETVRPSSLPERPPCPPPAGGWAPGQTDTDALGRYLAAHPDEYVDPWVTYPDGYPETDANGRPTAANHTTVAVVGTVLDPAAVEPALREVHPGNLCVVRVPRSTATLTAVAARLTTDTGWREHGVWSTSPDGITGRVTVELVVLDAAAQRWLRQADDRTGTVTPYSWVRPLR